jgi:hypothetical protein
LETPYRSSYEQEQHQSELVLPQWLHSKGPAR